ncbi:MAG: hypothetical protein HZY76_20270 [Anaerolineae bacterium]|nr:MAG: hypothetical protein HZY76_20270 [Anaerolineae bacterium]
MAHYFAIGAVSTALQGILMDARGEIGNPAIEIIQVSDIARERPAEMGISILLYRTVVSPLPRTLTGRTPPGVARGYRRCRSTSTTRLPHGPRRRSPNTACSAG